MPQYTKLFGFKEDPKNYVDYGFIYFIFIFNSGFIMTSKKKEKNQDRNMRGSWQDLRRVR